MKEINLEEIVRSSNVIFKERGQYESVLELMREACRQTLELAAENVRCDAPYGVDVSHMINRQSILDTINQIK